MPGNKTILIAEDSEHDVFLYRRAFAKLGKNPPQIVGDGRDVIEYLQGKGKFADRQTYPFPHCLWLDLKMPRMNGLEVLDWLKKHPGCAIVPTIVLSSSNLPNDVEQCYQLGAHSFFTKPSSLNETMDLIALVHHYWSICQIPDLRADRHPECESAGELLHA
jgi:CheY-like chemotaxis protein